VKRTPSTTDPGSPRFGRSRLLLPLAVSAVVLAIAAAGAGGWYAWKRGAEHRAAAVGSGASPSIAVLPFKDLSPNHDQEYFSDGMAEEILTALSKVKGLRVPGRASSFWFKGRNAKLEEIGRDLKVDHVLEGSVRRSGDKLRISAEVVRVVDGERVWSQSFDRALTDVFAVQDEIARATVAALRMKLLPEQGTSIAEYRPSSQDAHDSFLLGRHFAQSFSGDSQLRAIGALEKAVALDPAYAQAWAALARARLTAGTLGAIAWGDARRDALAAASRAVESGPTLPEALASRAQARLIEWDWQGAKADIDRALELAPRDPQASSAMARYLGWMGRWSERVEWELRHVEKEPLDGVAWNALGAVYMGANRMDEAGKAFARALEVDPRNEFARVNMCDVLLSRGRPVDALAALPPGDEPGLCRANAHFALGQVEESQKALDAMLRSAAGDQLFYIAQVYDYRGQTDLAIDWLERAWSAHVRAMNAIRGFSSSLRSNPRYTALLLKMNLPVAGEPAPAVVADASGTPSIAVLPFADMSPKHDQEYFADGVAESILNALAHVEGLKVVGRTSSFFFKGKPDDLKAIGQKLGVANVLEGSLRKDGNGIRVTAKLIRVADGTQLWSESFDRKLAGIFKVQDEIAKAVVAALKVKLLPQAVPRSGSVGTEKPAAYQEYLVGKHLLTQLSYEGADRAAQAFERALRIDPGYAPAWAGLSSALFGRSEDPAKETVASVLKDKRGALDAANRAVALAPALADGYIARANLVDVRGWDWTGALDDARRAIQLNPRDAFARSAHGELLVESGRKKDALPELELAVELDPLSANAWGWLGYGYMVNGRGADARRAWDRAKEIEPSNFFARAFGSSEPGKPMSRESALQITQRELGPRPDCFALMKRFPAFRALGEDGKARAAVEAFARYCGHTSAIQIANQYRFLGDRDRALDWLGKAIDQMDSGLKEFGRYRDKWRDFAAGDPRYTAAIRRMNLPPD
jgi:TolB-like protein/Flp pilus assembly protein TadD